MSYLIFLFTPVFLHAGQPTIHSIRFTGNRVFSDREIAGRTITAIGSRLSMQQLSADRESILGLYHERGYYFSNVRLMSEMFSSDSSSVDLVVDIYEGDSYTISAILLAGNSHLSTEQILQTFETRVGGFLDTTVLGQDIGRVLAAYERVGYPFASADVRDIVISSDVSFHALTISLSVDEGPRVMIDEIRITGNKETKSEVIVREMRIGLHEPFNEETVVKIPDRLNRMNIFTSVKEPQVFLGKNGGGLLIAVEEGNANTFDGVLGYVPSSGTDGGGSLSGMVNVTLGNLFGTARKLNVRWQRDDAQSQEMTLQYLEPWVVSLPLNIGGVFHQRKQDSLYVRREFEAKADLLLTESFSVGGILSQEEIIPSSTIFVQAVSNSHTLTTGIDIHYDTRDDALSPTHGVNYRTRYQIGSKRFSGLAIGGNGDAASVQKVSLDVDGYGQTFDRQVVAIGLHGRQTTSGRLELGDLYRFGGTNTLRGYRENTFIGSRVAWMNIEYRFLLARRSFFFGFVDMGYADLPADDVRHTEAKTQFNIGYGIGIRLETSLGNIGMSFALGQGDSFTQGKIHIGLVNQF
ncbi:MAG: BamA/TamA family outer membrane protein [Ignavibacteriae bacterium]|nr:BamA/TamA family outer membrane protein [Ignavibacteriota bacterium]